MDRVDGGSVLMTGPKRGSPMSPRMSKRPSDADDRSRRGGAAFSGRPGFTLIELLIVMVLIGLTVSIVIPNIGVSYDKFKFRGEVKRLVEFVERTKFHAFYYQKNVALSARDRRLVVDGLTEREKDIPPLEVEIPREIRFFSNGVASGGSIVVFYKGQTALRIDIERFSGRVTRTSL